MKSSPHLLDRLFRSAARAPQPESGPLPFVIEARVLAHWRSGVAEDTIEVQNLLRLLRRGLILASLLAVVVFALNYRQLMRRSLAEYAVATPSPYLTWTP